jgi:hypothetical protein
MVGLSEMDSPSVVTVTDFLSGLETDKDEPLRIFQIGGRSAKDNVVDLSFARGIDAALIQSDILEALRTAPPYPGIAGDLRYVAKLYDKEVHLLAGSEIKSIAALRGKKVNFGKVDSDNYLTAKLIFDKLGIDVEPTTLTPAAALEQVRSGELAALVYVAPKPADLFNFGEDERVHFLSIPIPGQETKSNAAIASEMTPLWAGYTPAVLQTDDYYQLIKPTEPVHTVAVGEILMVYNFPKYSPRYRSIARFVQQLLDAHARTGQSPIRWPDIDITAPVSGWTQYLPAAEWKKAYLERREPTRVATSSPPSPATVQLFTAFIEYQKQHAADRITLAGD